MNFDLQFFFAVYHHEDTLYEKKTDYFIPKYVGGIQNKNLQIAFWSTYAFNIISKLNFLFKT